MILRRKNGFTIIEVSLFLAITGLLFVSVTVGVQNSVFQQRYNDVVQSYADFLRNVYDEVMNVQSLTNGRHDMAIYGKLLTFGEADGSGEQVVYAYDVIGKAVNAGGLGSGATLDLLKQLGADVIYKENETDPYTPVGIIAAFRPNWGARIQPTDSEYEDYVGSILVVRDPKSGTVRTFLYDDVIEVNELVRHFSTSAPAEGEEVPHILTELLKVETFKPGTVDFCVNPKGLNAYNQRIAVRLAESAMNSSAVEVLPLDDDNNPCNK